MTRRIEKFGNRGKVLDGMPVEIQDAFSKSVSALLFLCAKQTNKNLLGKKILYFINFRSLLFTQNHFDRYFFEYNDSDTLKIPTVFLIDCRSQSTLNEHLTELHEVQHQARKSGCCWKFNASNGNPFSYACMKDPRWNWSKQMETQAA